MFTLFALTRALGDCRFSQGEGDQIDYAARVSRRAGRERSYVELLTDQRAARTEAQKRGLCLIWVESRHTVSLSAGFGFRMEG